MSTEEIISGVGETLTKPLPKHSNELEKAEEIIDEIKQRFKLLVWRKQFDGEAHTRLYEEIAAILDYVGNLSKSVFDVEEALEEEYKMEYLKSPALGKSLFWKHYEKLHHPYSLLKNRCFRLFTTLDTTYQDIHKAHPPNWKV